MKGIGGIVVGILALGVLLGLSHRAEAPRQRSKKENMIEMGQVYRALHAKIYTGAVEAKFTDADFQELSAQAAALIRLAEEYAKLETNADLANISRNLARDTQSVKNQADRKDAMLTVMLFGRLITYCAECHYQTRWP
ncbi:MAG: hypothetical protein N0A16_02895 [Blastocatellia bacterium]|nr:hypothetical protein [Blastocatellia bacterium]MCS7156663.1 hypothetical protein [Blastocatellia bacterium]MCX7751595.1 hypothetical protein [Blastocatellia bacterium]MDW8168695.1 hypothetical protein [Acidobacteriota bacterium]MDW8256961.1 hypothetical protein [Acidobacteriota bacterium]